MQLENRNLHNLIEEMVDTYFGRMGNNSLPMASTIKMLELETSGSALFSYDKNKAEQIEQAIRKIDWVEIQSCDPALGNTIANSVIKKKL